MPRSCSLCGSRSIASLGPIHAREFFACTGEGSCGMIFVGAAAHLDPDQERARYATHENDSGDARYRAFLDRVALPLAERLEPGAEGLDFGSGPGPTLALMLSERGFPTRNYDPFFARDPDALSHTYDFVTCTETAEHFFHPRKEFKQLSTLLRPGGWLALMTDPVPEGRPLLGWGYARDPTHVAFYRSRTLTWIARWLGWRLERPEPRVALYQSPAA